MSFSLWQFLGELLFPSFCCSCKSFGPYLCEYCYAKLQFYVSPVPLSRLPLEICYLDELIAAVEYEKTVGSLLHYLKYKHAKEIGDYCGDLLFFSTNFPKTDFISAVPLHSARQNERGYNQSEVMAHRLSSHINVPFIQLLKRSKKTASQASIHDRDKRLHNLENIFEFLADEELAKKISGKSILLIDDICTTGSTLNECAKILKENGAKSVFGLTVAHGS